MWSSGQPDEVLEGEPGDADGLNHGEGGVVDCLPLCILVLQTGKGADGHPDNWDRDKDGGENLVEKEIPKNIRGVVGVYLGGKNSQIRKL